MQEKELILRSRDLQEIASYYLAKLHILKTNGCYLNKAKCE